MEHGIQNKATLLPAHYFLYLFQKKLYATVKMQSFILISVLFLVSIENNMASKNNLQVNKDKN
jgi:hypothetical protein